MSRQCMYMAHRFKIREYDNYDEALIFTTLPLNAESLKQ